VIYPCEIDQIIILFLAFNNPVPHRLYLINVLCCRTWNDKYSCDCREEIKAVIRITWCSNIGQSVSWYVGVSLDVCHSNFSLKQHVKYLSSS
jgi:hypothetical protein